ncbi:MAG: molybdopterin-binding protein, partial [Hyphomicrobiaceae bacterium]
MSLIPIGILVSSDRAAAGIYEDKGGPGIESYLAEVLTTPWRGVKRIVPDDREFLEASLIDLADVENCPLILTTGGTGPAPRDVIPEATMAVCHRLLPGFGEAMRMASLKEVPTA